MSEDQKCVLYTANIIKEEFLNQDAFSKHDYNCPLVKTIGMLKGICTFYNECIKVLKEQPNSDKKLSMAYIEESMADNVIKSLKSMKFKDPLIEKSKLKLEFDTEAEEIEAKFRKILHG